MIISWKEELLGAAVYWCLLAYTDNISRSNDYSQDYVFIQPCLRRVK